MLASCSCFVWMHCCYIFLFFLFVMACVYKQDREKPKIGLRLAPVHTCYFKTKMVWLISFLFIMQIACIRVITQWIVNVLHTHFLTWHFKLAHVSKLGIILKLVWQYGLIMHSKLVVGHVFCDRFNGSLASTFSDAFQHSYQPCFLSQIQ